MSFTPNKLIQPASIAIVALLASVLSGCAAPAQFSYDHPQTTASTPGMPTLAVADLIDQRAGPSEIDNAYVDDPVDEIDDILEEELLSTGLFGEVVRVQADEDISLTKPDLLMTAELLEIQWEVPDYDAIVAKAFTTSLLTGGIGGVFYGSTETDVYGDTLLHVRVVDFGTGQVLLDNSYAGHSEERMAKLQCDTPSTKALMVGKALKLAMEQLKADLSTVANRGYEGAEKPAAVSTTIPEPNAAVGTEKSTAIERHWGEE